MMQHGAEPQSDVVKQILASIHDKGQGTGPRNEVGPVLYMRGVVGAMLAIEGARAAQAKFGPGKPVTPEQARWGYENLKLTQADLDALGFKGVMRPVATTCSDHMGSAWARVHTWDGVKFVWASDWLQADKSLIDPMVKASAEKYAAEKKMTRRTKEDCQP
jgi:branched-chain amino acid transport system substrate-binding protein